MRRFRRTHEATPEGSESGELRVPQLTGKDLLEWGMPGRCPTCGAFGYLDRIDLVDEVMYQHCPSCWEHWAISKHEIQVSAARPSGDAS